MKNKSKINRWYAYIMFLICLVYLSLYDCYFYQILRIKLLLVNINNINSKRITKLILWKT